MLVNNTRRRRRRAQCLGSSARTPAIVPRIIHILTQRGQGAHASQAGSRFIVEPETGETERV